MKDQVLSDLAGLFGPDHVTRDEERLAAYFRGPVPSIPLVAVSPSEAGQVSELVRYAGSQSIPLFTLKDVRFSVYPPASGGIVVDFSRMNTIERIDARNLSASIQRGVTWEQLGRELERNGLKTLLPAASTSPYVLEDMVSRVIMRSAARYPEAQVSNLRVVLADGRVHPTGSHALSEDGCDSKDDGGPNLSRWYFGAEDIYGIPVRATIWLYPVPRTEEFLFFGFEDLAPALSALRNIPRKELCDQAMVMNACYVRHLVPGCTAPLPSWLFWAGCEGRPQHVEHLTRTARQDAASLGGKELPELREPLAPALHRVWKRPSDSHGFYTFIRRIPEFHAAVTSQAKTDLGELFVAHAYGRAAWCEFDYLEPLPHAIDATVETTNDLLLEKGAYFDRPLGTLADKFYRGNPAYLEQITRVKRMMDPNRILNPDQLLTGV